MAVLTSVNTNSMNSQYHETNASPTGQKMPSPAIVPDGSARRVYNMLSPKVNYLKKNVDNMVCLKEGPILQYGLRKRAPKKRYMFLLNDVILICKKLSDGKYNPRWIILLNSRKVAEVVSDSTYAVPNAEFRLYTPKRTFIFFAENQFDRDDWLRVMQGRIRASELRENPPVRWEFNQPKFY